LEWAYKIHEKRRERVPMFVDWVSENAGGTSGMKLGQTTQNGANSP